MSKKTGVSKTGRTVKNPIGTVTTRTKKGQLKTAPKSKVDALKKQRAKRKLLKFGKNIGKGGVVGAAIGGYEILKDLPSEEFKTVKELERGKMSTGERKIKPLPKDKKRGSKKTKATSLPVPKRKPTPPKQKKTTDRIPGPDETETFVSGDAVIDYKGLPKVKRQAGGALKPIDPETQPGLVALKKESPETVNKMGYAKKGGRIVSAMTGGQIVSMMYDD